MPMGVRQNRDECGRHDSLGSVAIEKLHLDMTGRVARGVEEVCCNCDKIKIKIKQLNGP